MFLSNQGFLATIDEKAEKVKKTVKARDCYGLVFDRVKSTNAAKIHNAERGDLNLQQAAIQDGVNYTGDAAVVGEGALVPANAGPGSGLVHVPAPAAGSTVQSIMPRRATAMPKPKWHAPWKLYRVISGHLGWVRCVAVEPGNEWFATGSADRVIKIWDLASGHLKVSLTGHISSVRGLAVSARHPYLFSCGEDRQVKCWDLEYNKVIRHYHGHLSAVYSLALHPNIDVLVTAGRDVTCRVWDMRTKANVHTLTGHTNTIASVVCQAAEPQIVTGSHDCTIRLWDLAAGKSKATLTNHKKSVRSLVFHPTL
jgi:pleiotropic regulator 1